MKLNLNNIDLVMTAGLVSQFPDDGLPQIAFSGRSNVGKSSLLNSLIGRKSLARTSSAPGKTITVNFYQIDRKLYLVDLPGYGYAQRSATDQAKWSALVEEYVTGEKGPGLVLQLVELKLGPTKNDEMMIEWMNQCGMKYIIVATKADKLNKTEYNAAISRLEAHPTLRPGTPIFPYSVKSPGTRDYVWEAIKSHLTSEANPIVG